LKGEKIMINGFYYSLEEMGFDYALAELREKEKELTVYDVLHYFREHIVNKIKNDVDFELTSNDIEDINAGIGLALAEYFLL